MRCRPRTPWSHLTAPAPPPRGWGAQGTFRGDPCRRWKRCSSGLRTQRRIRKPSSRPRRSRPQRGRRPRPPRACRTWRCTSEEREARGGAAGGGADCSLLLMGVEVKRHVVN
eukprot:3055284-Prymnesium_polylepis.1